ncbi:MAG: hypothetical protein HEQ38_07905 [Gemmatimonas sp.]|jgi:hypothetical protein|uniref:hypothetical protein n=1 Tax=Gemmatimonas sp. TaxID=1962908 RepID=UPI0031CB02C6|nr:hypothetical protein [Gemmatimonas sp.]
MLPAAYDRTVLYVVDVSAVPTVSSVGLRGADRPLSRPNDTPLTPVADSAGLYTATVTAKTARLTTGVKVVVNGTFEFSDSQDDSNRHVSLPQTTTGGDTIRFRATHDKR